MATFNKKSHNRSVSLPARSHPSTVKIEQLVNKIKTLETSSSSSSSLRTEKICSSLSGLKELYQGIEELLALPLTQRALAQDDQQDQCERINALLDESVLRYIDICSSSRDKIMLMKERIQGLQSTFRRSKVGDLSIENEVSAFVSSRKAIRKEISKSLGKLKHTENKNFPLINSLSDLDDQLIIVLRAIAETSLLTMSCFSSLLLFLSSSALSKSKKPTGWSLVSKLMYKGQRCNFDELESIDMALNNLILSNSYGGTEKIESIQRKLEGLEAIMENLENGLDVLFRHLIRTRVSLLNTFSK